MNTRARRWGRASILLWITGTVLLFVDSSRFGLAAFALDAMAIICGYRMYWERDQ